MVDSIRMIDRNAWIVLPAALSDAVPGYFELLEADGYALGRFSDGRFPDDRCLASNQDYVLLIDGVILNKSELLEETGDTSLLSLMMSLLHAHGIPGTLARLRGVFSGAILDRREHVLHGFGNQTGESAAFHYSGSRGRILSNSFDLMMRILRSDGTTVSFDEHAAQVMLSYGFMVDDHTFAREIRRVGPGQVLSVDLLRGESETRTYWRLKPGTSKVATIDGAVSEFDRLFRRAVMRCFNKDLEYGYERHLVDVSGGLDARMVNVVARDLGYGSITNITYSESGSDENRYAVKFATRFGNHCLYYPMDGGESLLDPEENLRLNSGMAYYAGITGGAFVLRNLNFAEYGLEHTGQIGDVVVGTYLTSPERKPPVAGAGAYSRVNTYPPSLDGDDEELYLMNTRAFRGVMSTHLLRQHFTYAVSPYADVDLLEFAFSLPLEWRLHHRLFVLWIQGHYPSALTVPTTRRLPLRAGPIRYVMLFTKKVMAAIASKVQGRPGTRRSLISPAFKLLRNNMNPFDSWYAVNPEIRALVAASRECGLRLPIGRSVRDSLERSFSDNGTILDRLLAVTVVTMYSIYFSNDGRPRSL